MSLAAIVDRPFIWLLPFYMVGVIWGWNEPDLSPPILFAVAFISSAIGGLLLCTRLKLGYKLSFVLLAVAVAQLGAGLTATTLTPPHHSQHILNFISQNNLTDPIILGGYVHADSRWSPGKNHRLIIDAQEILIAGPKGASGSYQVHGLARLSVGGRVAVEVGDYVRLPVVLRPLAGLRNPGTYEFEKYWNAKGVWLGGYVKSPRLVTSWPEIREAELINQWRDRAANFVESQVPQPASGLLASMLLGRRGAVDEHSEEIFRSLGLSHLLAVSGLHLGLWYALCFWLVRHGLRLSRRFKTRGHLNLVSAFLALLPALFYASLVGTASPVVRATVMIAVVTFATLAFRRTDPWNILATAAWVLLIADPPRLFTASFQLSFVATWAMLSVFSLRPGQEVAKKQSQSGGIWTSPCNLATCRLIFRKFFSAAPAATVATQSLSSGYNKPSFFRSALVASLAGTLGTAPVVVWHFSRLPVAGLAANLVFTPLISFFVLIPGLLSLALLPFNYTLASWVLSWAGVILNGLMPVLEGLATWVGPGWLLPAPGIAVFVGWYLAGWIWLRSAQPWRRRLIISSLVLAIGFLPGLINKPGEAGVLHFTVLDVGQGTSIHISFPDGRQMLVDGGGGYKFDPGEAIVTPYLLHQGVGQLDIVALSHPDQDHLKGLIAITENFKPQEVWSAPWPPDTSLHYSQFLDKIPPGSRMELHPLYDGRNFGSAKVTLLWPRFDQGPWLDKALSDDWHNHYGLVLRVEYGDESFLVTGDIGPEVELALAERYKGELKSSVLIGPHHGSRTSLTPEFLAAVQPRWVVFNAGLNNFYGLPHPEAVGRAEKYGSHVWRTDLSGAVIFEVHLKNGSSTLAVRGVK